MTSRYSVARTTEGRLGPGRVEVERLSEQLTPIVDAFIAIFNRVPARSRGQLQELEVGLVVTQEERSPSLPKTCDHHSHSGWETDSVPR